MDTNPPSPTPPGLAAPEGPSAVRRSRWLPLPVLAGLVAACVAVVLIVGLFLRSTHQLSQTSGHVAHTLDVINEADQLLSLVKDVETSQRGYLLTGEERYLAPYEEARLRLGPTLERLRALVADDASQRERLGQMEAILQKKLEVNERTVALARAGQAAAARENMRSGGGQKRMDALRVLERELREEEQRRLEGHNALRARAARSADVIVLTGSGFLLLFIGFAGVSFLREVRSREHEQRQRAEAVLRESEAQLLRTLKAAEVGSWELDLRSRSMGWSPNIESMVGLAPNTFQGTAEAAAAFIHPEDRDFVRRTLDETVRTRGELHLTYRILRLDGALRWQEVRSRVLLDESGQPAKLAGVVMDVTSRRLAEQLQRESEERFRLLAETLPQLIWMTRADGYSEYFNPRWYEYTGQTPEQAKGEGWSQALHPDDFERTLEVWRRAVATGEPYGIEYRLRRGSDGAYRWFIARGLPLRDAAGRITHWFGTSTDIDDQKRGAESMRFLSEASMVLTASLDQAATLQQVARLAVPVLADWCLVDLVGEDGHVERVEVAHANPGRTALADWLRCYPPVDNLEHPSARAMRSDKTVFTPVVTREFEERSAQSADHLRAIRELRLRSMVSVPLLARGRTLGVLTFAMTEDSGRRHEESDVLRIEELARRAAMALDNARLFSLARAERQRAEEANRLKDDFLATVSHELRTPLTAMLGWVKMLRSGRLAAEKHARALETVDRNAQAQAQLIEDLLDVSRIISGKLRLETRPVRLGEVLQAAMESVRPAAEAKGIRVLAELDTEGDGVMGDPSRLQQVVWNLLSNAVKFSPGDSRVWVELKGVEGSVEVTVRDEGPGIPADFLPHIFERFRQLESGTTRRHGGLGLGLAIVRHLVELHGGTVRATSEGEGRGATFQVLLPAAASRLAAPEATPARRATAPQSLVSPPSAVLARRCILVVDDEEDNREVLKVMLEEYGARVLTAASAAEGLRAVREGRPELLISDIGMPGEDGYRLIAQVRALPAEEGGQVPAVALTAYARVEDRARALTAGFNMHVAKPVEPSELLTILSNLVTLTPGN